MHWGRCGCRTSWKHMSSTGMRSRCRCGGFLGRTHDAMSVRDLLCVGVQPAPGWRAPASRGGRLAVEHQLSEAPDALRSFLRGNIMPGVDADGHSINNLGLRLERLQFCESALVVGSLVTRVGEIDRDREGVLFISSWRPF